MNTYAKTYPDVIVQIPLFDDHDVIAEMKMADYLQVIRDVADSIASGHRDFQRGYFMHDAMEFAREGDYPGLYEYIQSLVWVNEEYEERMHALEVAEEE